MTFSILRKSILYISFLFALLINFQDLFSQSKYTVLLPEIDKAIPVSDSTYLEIKADLNGKETIKSFFRFDFKSLPDSAKIHLLNLKLYLAKDMEKDKFASQVVYVLKGTDGWTGDENDLSDPNLNWANKIESIGREELTERTQYIGIKLNTKELFNNPSEKFPKGFLSLAIRSPQAGNNTKFFSSIISENGGDYSKKPKLLVNYRIETEPVRADWSQPYANAQHTSSIKWKANTYMTEVQIRKIPAIQNEAIQKIDPTNALVIYKNNPIIFTKIEAGADKPFFVKQLDSEGNVVWIKGVDDAAKCWPLIDEYGRLYYISRSGRLTILDLNNKGEILYNEPLSKITKEQIKSINNNATLGYDGTLYLPSDKGIIALTAYPQFKIRWFYRQLDNEINGPVSLSPDESKAFFININTLQGKSRLMVLDNMDGTPVVQSDFVLGGFSNDGNMYIPAPVVQNNEKVFVLNGYDNSNKLFIFDSISPSKIGLDSIYSQNSENTGISQPIIVDSTLFFVFNNKLARYTNNPSTQKNDFHVFDNSTELDNASILVSDASFNIYAIDPYEPNSDKPQKILGFKNDTSNPNSFSLNIDKNTGNLKKNIVLAPDGTLYTVNDNNLFVVKPRKVAIDDLDIKQADLNTNTVYHANKSITAGGIKVNSNINAILYSGGSISFKPGFSIKKGAKLTCKIGY